MKRSRSPIRDTKESLSHLTRRQIQQKAKTMGIKANMKTTEIIDEIVKRLREDEELEEEVASTRRGVSHTTPAQPQASPETCPLSHDSRGRTRASQRASQGHRRTSPMTIPQPQLHTGIIGDHGPIMFDEVEETRCSKRRRLAAEEFNRAAEEAAEMQEAARKAQQKAEVARAVALHLVNDDEARTPGRTIYAREPTPLETTPVHTPVQSRANSPEEEIVRGDDYADRISPVIEQSQRQAGRQMQESDQEDEDESDKENGIRSNSELVKEKSAPSVAAPSLLSEELNTTVYDSRTQSAGDSASPRPASPVAASPIAASPILASPVPSAPSKKPAPKPITTASINEAHRRLAQTLHRLTDVRTQVKRNERTITKMREHVDDGARILDAMQWKTLALEENLMRHIKRNPTLLDGNAFDEEKGGPDREEAFRYAYYLQQKRDRAAEEEREREKEARREEEARIAAEEEEEEESDEEEYEMDPDVAALMERGGDLSELLDDNGAGPSGSRAWGSDDEEDSEDDDDDDGGSDSGESADVEEDSGESADDESDSGESADDEGDSDEGTDDESDSGESAESDSSQEI